MIYFKKNPNNPEKEKRAVTEKAPGTASLSRKFEEIITLNLQHSRGIITKQLDLFLHHPFKHVLYT